MLQLGFFFLKKLFITQSVNTMPQLPSYDFHKIKMLKRFIDMR